MIRPFARDPGRDRDLVDSGVSSKISHDGGGLDDLGYRP
jgi:hypothetical protein